MEYYLGTGERAGVWLGEGARRLALTGQLDERGTAQLRALLQGCDLEGQVVSGPVWRMHPGALLPAAPLVAAARRTLGSGRRSAEQLLGPGPAAVLRRAEMEVERDLRRSTLPRAALSASRVVQLLEGLQLSAGVVYAGFGGGAAVRDALAKVDDRVDVRRSGLDLTFSAPKSVSVLFGLSETPVASQVRAAHESALRQSLAYLEGHVARAMRGHHTGTEADHRIATDGLIAVAFEHRSSRCGDPQLHTHVVIPNMARAVDGRWSALDTRMLYEQASTAGYLYQAVLRAELSRRLGVRWGPVRNGMAELEAVPSRLCRLFSQRRQQIERALQSAGLSGSRASQAATLATRAAKAPVPPEGLRAVWQSQAKAAGYASQRVIREVLHRSTAAPAVTNGELLQRLTGRLLAASGLTQKKAAFDRRELLRAVCETVPAEVAHSAPHLRALATAVMRDPRVIRLAAATPEAGALFSTQDMLATEQQALQLARGMSLRRGWQVATPQIEQALQDSMLSSEQAQLVRQLCRSGAGVQVVVGPAGSGKTAALAALAVAHRMAGRQVNGVALAAIAARGLERGAGIPSVCLSELLAPLDDRDIGVQANDRMSRGSLLVVDEAGMIGTRQLYQLLRAAAARDVAVLLVGDPRQLPEIDAGGLFAALARCLPQHELHGNQRQQQPWERRALTQLREGDPLMALEAYDNAGRVHVSDDPSALHTGLLDVYEHHVRQGHDVIVLASSRAQVLTLNEALREHMQRRGRLTGKVLQLPVEDGRPLELQRGDQVVVTRNERRLGLHNGTRGVITAVRRERVRLTNGGRNQWLSRADLTGGLLQHGYALTVHRAQGMTTDVSLFAASANATRELGYVAMSRGRIANHLFATGESLLRLSGRPNRQAGHDEHLPPEPTPNLLSAELHDLTQAALTERLSRSGAQGLASGRIRALLPQDARLVRGP